MSLQSYYNGHVMLQSRFLLPSGGVVSTKYALVSFVTCVQPLRCWESAEVDSTTHHSVYTNPTSVVTSFPIESTVVSSCTTTR
jgi:hypothetical protein